MRTSAIMTAVIFLVGLLLLTACGGLQEEIPTPTPLPTSSLPGLVTVPSQLCRLIELAMLKVDEPQGDLLAWAPETDTLAYVSPTTGSTWMVGTLMITGAPTFDTPEELADRVAGDLAWSPDGSKLAYLTLRRSDDLFSVEVINLQSGFTQDLFPGEAARYDQWSSQKAVLGWEDESRLQVQVSCGLDCIQNLEVNLVDGALTPLGEAVQRSWDWWSYTLNQAVELPAEYQAFMNQPNWSPDGRRLTYLDARADAWVVVLDERIQFPLDTGGFLAVSETDWSGDGIYLAVQAEDSLFIFSADCP